MKEDTLIIKKDDMYAFRDYENNLNIPVEMVEKLKQEMNYEEAIMCFVNSLVDVEHKSKEIERLNNTINKAIEYTDSCIFDYEENTMIGEDFKIIKNILKGYGKE